MSQRTQSMIYTHQHFSGTAYESSLPHLTKSLTLGRGKQDKPCQQFPYSPLRRLPLFPNWRMHYEQHSHM